MPALAHHSYAMFDMQQDAWRSMPRSPSSNGRTRTASSKPTSAAPGGSEHWAIEMTSPNNLVQEGWKRTSLKPGDKVTLYVHPLRTGAKGGSYVGVRLARRHRPWAT